MAQEGRGAEHTAWESVSARLGLKGLQLNTTIDALDPQELSRMSNVFHSGGSGLTTRPGATRIMASSGASIHTMARLNDPQAATFNRFWGIDTGLFAGQTSASPIDSGYSGNPLTLVPNRPHLSGDPWLLVADSNRMRRVNRAGSLVLPIGLAAPASITTAIQSILTTDICRFDSTDGSQAANWTSTAGVDRSESPRASGVGTPTDGTDGAYVRFTTAPGQATVGYHNIFGISRSINLTKLQSGTIDADDEDIMRFFMRVSEPGKVEEIRFYLVASSGFAPNIIPGTHATSNLKAFMKAFRPSDFTPFIEVLTSQPGANAPAVARSALDRFQLVGDEVVDAKTGEPVRGFLSGIVKKAYTKAQRQPSQSKTEQLVEGRDWTEFGVVGIPLRRGDFLPIGNTDEADWATISGIVIVIQTANKDSIYVDFDDTWLTGGGGPDASEPGALKYDYRATNYDPRTGVESNPTAVQADALKLSPLRQRLNAQASAASDPNLRQRFYRRGGTITDTWRFVGTSSANGGVFTDNLNDDSIRAAAELEIDHDQPITTQDANGNTILAQPVPAMWGPVNGLMLACGDPKRPGHLYWSKREMPDYWPAINVEEVCPPSEELMNGCVYGGESYVFSRDRLYRNYVDFQSVGAVRSGPTTCRKGLAGRWAFSPTPFGIAFVAKDGIWITQGGNPDLLSDQLRPLFYGESKFGFLSIDLTQEAFLRLEYTNNELWFTYKDSGGTVRTLIYSFLYQYWRPHTFMTQMRSTYGEPDTGVILLGAHTLGRAYTHDGFTDDGTQIACSARTGAQDFGRPREEKLFGDVFVDAIMHGAALTVQTFLNAEAVTNTAQSVTGTASVRERLAFDPFGATPQRARTLSLELSWTAPTTARPVIEYAGVSVVPQPDLTYNRATTWDDLGNPTEKFVVGVMLEADTGNTARTIIVEYDLDGQTFIATTLTVQHNGRRKQGYSWPAVKGNLFRLRPAGTCQPWVLYRHDWLEMAEPPRIANVDTNWEIGHDVYYTGVDLDIDTFGNQKTFEILADQAVVKTELITTSGRRIHHVTLTPARAHHLRFRATDQRRCLLYGHKWWSEDEPTEQANWNQNFTVAGTQADKYLKGVVLECDTFGLTKTINIEVDGVVVQTFNVTQSGRGVQEFSFPQSLGRVFRLLPADTNNSRLYSMSWIFDQEPLSLTRFETQEVDHGIPTWQTLLFGHVTIRSTAAVTLNVKTYNQSGALMGNINYTLASTAGLKTKRYVQFQSQKGVLFKYVLTSASAFWLYREESIIKVQPWGSQQAIDVHPFGNDDLDPARGMGNAALAAATPGGALSRQ